jgi:hypothetical protein
MIIRAGRARLGGHRVNTGWIFVIPKVATEFETARAAITIS